jgi:UDP-N-acetylmuramoyl-L-alanyl-D-glutamate--2,6-diaminopimelate ligase
VRFHTAVFTNLTRDHLDYHGTMEAYGASKAMLFEWSGIVARIINVDDDFGAKLAKQPSSARLVVTTRRELPADLPAEAQFVRATRVQAETSGLALSIESSWGAEQITVPFIGDFNVDNVLTVLATMLTWGIPFADATRALTKCRAPSGRMELFGGRDPLPLVVVDYAHTPDALSKALRASRVHCRGRLSVIFGCGGDRDAGKRPLMGTIAAELADDIVLTDDNPRNEDPRRIVADIAAGLRTPVVSRATSVRVEHDRKRAITSTLANAVVGDVIVVAGKGHEDYQIYGTERRSFSDQAVIREYFGEEA